MPPLQDPASLSGVCQALRLQGSGKRARGTAGNPFEQAVEETITTQDGGLFQRVFTESNQLLTTSQQGIQVGALMESFSVADLESIINTLTHGRETYPAKVQCMVRLLPTMGAIDTAAKKLRGTYGTLETKLAKTVWDYYANLNDGRFAIDVIKKDLKDILSRKRQAAGNGQANGADQMQT